MALEEDIGTTGWDRPRRVAFAAWLILAAPLIQAAVADRTTIPLRDHTASSAFARPITHDARDRAPVLPDYDFSTARTPLGSLPSAERHRVSRIELIGNQALDHEDVDSLLAEYEDRELSFSEMVELRDRLTALYVAQGYVTSGAVLESLDDGVLRIIAVEGRLTEIRVNDDGHFRPQYVSGYLEGFGTPTPVNVFDLEERLQIFQREPHVELIEAELLPGTNRGESVLWVDPVETNRWALGLEASNQLSPAIGAVQAVASVNALNLTGRADDLRLGARGAEGLLEFMGEYDFPLGTRGHRVALYAFGADSDIVRGPFNHLDIGADSLTAGARLRMPLQRGLEQNTNMVFALEWRRSRTYLLGQGFSFVEGPEEGDARMAILRGGIESLRRTAADVIYGRVELSAGIDAFGATINEDPDVPDTRFLKVRGQFQWARRLPWLDSQLLMRLDGQLSNDPLFGLEQYPIGGRWTVRGYRENTLIRDNAVIASAEWRLPLWQSSAGRSLLELRPFVDWSHSGNVNADEIGPRSLASAGLGVFFSPVDSLQMEVYWGEALKEIDYGSDYDLQDDGIHFRFVWDAAL
jgi:hemolysin activation/secretion protein